MGLDPRIDELFERLEQLEKKQDQRWKSYKRLLNGILRALGGDAEREVEDR